MTEINDLGAFFSPPKLTDEQQQAQQALMDRMNAEEIKAWAQVQFFAPILCSCSPRYLWGEPRPPQAGCIVHGGIQYDREGHQLIFARPPEPHTERS